MRNQFALEAAAELIVQCQLATFRSDEAVAIVTEAIERAINHQPAPKVAVIISGDGLCSYSNVPTEIMFVDYDAAPKTQFEVDSGNGSKSTLEANLFQSENLVDPEWVDYMHGVMAAVPKDKSD